MRFLELYNNETEQNEFFNMDKVVNIAPETEEEGGGVFTEGTMKETGSTLYFESGEYTSVKQTAKEVFSLIAASFPKDVVVANR